MGLICKLFGHRIEPRTYGKYWGGASDGIGRRHGYYHWPCQRCGKKVRLHVHFPTRKLTDPKGLNGWGIEANNGE